MDAAVGSIELEHAYEVLGVTGEASDDEVRDSYRKLAQHAHPDQGGTDEAMAALVDAYALVRAARGKGENSLVLRRTEIALGVNRDPVRRAELSEDSQRAFDKALRHTTLRLKQAKRHGTWAALASAGLGIVVGLLKTFGLDTVSGPLEDETWLSSTLRLALVVAFLVVGAFFAFLAWRASARVNWLESALDDFSDSLSDKNSFLRLMRLLRREAGMPPQWTRDDLISAIQRWTDSDDRPLTARRGAVSEALFGLILPNRANEEIELRDLARIGGPGDTAQLVISKGLERDLIAERPSGEEDGGYVYALTV